MTTDLDIEIQPSAGSGAWAEIEAGSYNAIVDSIEDTGVSSAFPDSGPQLKFGFALEDELDDDGNMIVLNRWLSQKWSEKSNLFKLAMACGLQPDPSVAFKVSTLKGQKCQVVVERKNIGQLNERPGITAFMPRQKARGAASRRAAAAATPEAASDLGPCVLCGDPATRYTGKGKPICDGCA